MRKPALVTLTTVLLYMKKFARVTFGVVRIWALLTFGTRVRQKKFANFLNKTRILLWQRQE
jgi:hypothetical protein